MLPLAPLQVMLSSLSTYEPVLKIRTFPILSVHFQIFDSTIKNFLTIRKVLKVHSL